MFINFVKYIWIVYMKNRSVRKRSKHCGRNSRKINGGAGFFGNLFSDTKSALNSTKDKISSKLQNTGQSISTAASNTYSAVQKAPANIKSAVENAPDNIKTAVQNAPSNIVSTVKASGNILLRQDSGIRLKYLFSLLNPANADRMICKNEFFVEFLDMETVKPLFPYVNEIKMVLEGGRVYLFSDKAVPPSFQLPSKKSDGVVLDPTKVKNKEPEVSQPIDELPDEDDDKDNTDGNEKDNAENDDLANDHQAESHITAEEDDANKLMRRLYPASRANKYGLTALSALTGGLVANFESLDIYKSRLTFADINDSPLVEKSTWENSGIGRRKKWLKFDDKYDVFFRFLHYFKYQLNRTLWDPVEIVTHSRMRFLFKSMTEMISQNVALKNEYKSNVYLSLPTMSLRNKALKLNPLMKTLVFGNPPDNMVSVAPDDEAHVSNQSNDQSNNTNTPYVGQSVVRLIGKMKDSGMILSWKLISKLKKYYDFESPLNARPPNIKYMVLDKKFPKYMENEVKFAMFTLLAFLKGRANNVNIIEEANSTFGTKDLRRINIGKLQNALGLKSNFGGMGVESNGDLSRLEISIDKSFGSYIEKVLSNQSKIARMIRDEYYKGIKDLVNVVPQLMIQDIQNKGTELIREWVKDKPDKKYEYEAQQFYRNGMGQIRKIFKDYKNSVVASRYSCDGNCQSNNNTIRKIRYELFGVADIGIDISTIQTRIEKIEKSEYHEKIFHNLKCAFVESIAYLYLYYFRSINLTDTINLNDIQISKSYIQTYLYKDEDKGLLYNRVKFTYRFTDKCVTELFDDSDNKNYKNYNLNINPSANNIAFKKAYVDNFYKQYADLLNKNKIEIQIDTTQPVTLKYGPKQVSDGNTIYYGNDLEQFPIAWFKNLTIRQMVTLLEDAASDRKTEADETFSNPAPNATAPNAAAPNATAPNATAPNATAPNATAPNATAPNATAPKKSGWFGGNRTRRRQPHTHRVKKPNRKHLVRKTRERKLHKTRKMTGGAGNMPNISRAMDYVFDSCNCWMVKRMMNSFLENAKSNDMILKMARFFIMIQYCMANLFNVLFATLGIFIINESIPGLSEARRTATAALAALPLIRSAVEVLLTVPTLQCAAGMALIAELMYYTQTGLNASNLKEDAQLELDILCPPFVDWVKDDTEQQNRWIQESFELKSIGTTQYRYTFSELNSIVTKEYTPTFKSGWYYVDGRKAENIAYIRSCNESMSSNPENGKLYELDMFYYVAFRIDKVLSPKFRKELFHGSVIITALTKIKPPDIFNQNMSDLDRYVINDNTVIGTSTESSAYNTYVTPAKPRDSTAHNNRFVWMNGMFLGYMRQFENRKTHGFETYRFIEANEDLTDGNLVSNVRNPKLWFLKNYLVSKTTITNIKTTIHDIKTMYKEDKRNLYFTYYPDDNSLNTAIDKQTY